MPSGALLDNDVVLKTCCYAAIDAMLGCLGKVGPVAVLGMARFVLASRIAKARNIVNKASATAALAVLLAAADTVEPDSSDVALAAEFEAEASARGVALDSGESLLLAVLLQRGTSLMLTGDKRAVAAIEAVAWALGCATRATGRVACLEQLFMELLARCEAEWLHERVCSEPEADKALSVCFACNSHMFIVDSAVDGLVSYINDLRIQAPTVLVATDDLSAVFA
jgi:hypothetical protein